MYFRKCFQIGNKKKRANLLFPGHPVRCRCSSCSITIKNSISSAALPMCKHNLYSRKEKICMIIDYSANDARVPNNTLSFALK